MASDYTAPQPVLDQLFPVWFGILAFGAGLALFLDLPVLVEYAVGGAAVSALPTYLMEEMLVVS